MIDEQKIIDLYTNIGLNASEISFQLGITLYKVLKILKKNKILIRNGRVGKKLNYRKKKYKSILDKNLLDKICNLYLSGLSIDDISSQENLSPYIIKKELKIAGIKIRTTSRKNRPNKKDTNYLLNKYSMKIGDKFNFFTIKECYITNCLCECVCGNNITISGFDLKHNRKLSCGCQRTGKNSPLWKGYKGLSNSYFSHIKADANRRHLDFSITIEFIVELFYKQNELCKLSKLPIKFSNSYGNNKGRTASLDRIDSNKGYTEDNVQWVHKDINTSKWDFSQERYIEMCKLVANNN